MSARAPGKLVLSGAYAVLRGAPAIVSAVNRYAYASSDRPAEFLAEEVQAFLREFPEGARPQHPCLNADELRQTMNGRSQKLGLGSSAALLCAAIAVILAEVEGAPVPQEEIFARALQAHRRAQGGGSGVDVAAAAFGGTRSFRLEDGAPSSRALLLPKELVVEAWIMPEPASTSDFVKRVFALEASEPRAFALLLAAQAEASEAARSATERGATDEFLRALDAQTTALRALGASAGVPIIVPTVDDLREALPSGSAWIPSGAGGGDVTLYFSRGPSSAAFRTRAQARGLRLLDVELGAPGTELIPEASASRGRNGGVS